jgi:hypothetical protein
MIQPQAVLKDPASSGPGKLAAHIARLTFIGLAMQAIYLLYMVAFPLVSNTQKGGPAADLEILMRDQRWFAPIYVAGILLLYYLFWKALRWAQDLPGAAFQSSDAFHRYSKLLVLAFGLMFGLTLVWLYPITANDLFRYVLRGRIWAVYGQSPMLAPPNNFPNDPYLAFAGEFGNWVSGYGPLWEILVQIPLRLGATDMVPGAVSLKLLVLLAYLACAVLLGWFAGPRRAPGGDRERASLLALIFFAWNPLILMQGPGNGHNDMVFLAFMVAGIILWQRGRWWWAAANLTLAALVKATGLLMLPLFGMVLLRDEPAWRGRILKGLAAIFTGLALAGLYYAAVGPVPQVFRGVFDMLTTRRGFAIADGLRMALREIIPRQAAETVPATTGRYIFLIFYAGLVIQLWRGKLNLVGAGFLAYFSQIMLGRTFRIWYPTWLVPLAALHLASSTSWRTLLFGLTAELSIVNYFVVWRWWLRDLPAEVLGPLSQYWNYWTVMHTLTVPWLFGIPLLGPILMKWRQRSVHSPIIFTSTRLRRPPSNSP